MNRYCAAQAEETKPLVRLESYLYDKYDLWGYVLYDKYDKKRLSEAHFAAVSPTGRNGYA